MKILITERQFENISHHILSENVKAQREKFIKQGYESNIVDGYLQKFNYIKDKKFSEIFDDNLKISIPKEKRLDISAYKDFHDLEVLVDYVSGRRKVVSGLSQNDIDVDAKPIYEDNRYVVYYADNPKACIKYKGNIPYGWCVSRSDSSNMFYTYRLKNYQPAFYFVKDKLATKKEFDYWSENKFENEFKDKYHFFVVQVMVNANVNDVDSEQYIVTSANNDGDVSMSWRQIMQLNDGIDKIREYLQPKPLSKEQTDKIIKYGRGLTDKEFEKLTYEDKRDYLDIYPGMGKKLSDYQFYVLPDDLMNLYVSFGLGLSYKQFEIIKNKKSILKRYAEITKRKFNEYLKAYQNGDDDLIEDLKLVSSEVEVLNEQDRSEYFKLQHPLDVWYMGYAEKPSTTIQLTIEPNQFFDYFKSDVDESFVESFISGDILQFYDYYDIDLSSILDMLDNENESKIMEYVNNVATENGLDIEGMDLEEIVATYDDYFNDLVNILESNYFDVLNNDAANEFYKSLKSAVEEYGTIIKFGLGENIIISVNPYDLIDDHKIFMELLENCEYDDFYDNCVCVFDEALGAYIDKPTIDGRSIDNAYVSNKEYNKYLKYRLGELG